MSFMKISPEEEKQFLELAKDPDIIQKLIKVLDEQNGKMTPLCKCGHDDEAHRWMSNGKHILAECVKSYFKECNCKKFTPKGENKGDEMMKLKIGTYEPRVVKKGVEEAPSLRVAEGDTYWVVQTDKDGQLDVETQTEAEIISRLVRIENLLKKR